MIETYFFFRILAAVFMVVVMGFIAALVGALALGMAMIFAATWAVRKLWLLWGREAWFRWRARLST